MKSNVGVKGEGSGPDLEQAIESRDSGSGFRIRIQDRDSGSGSVVECHRLGFRLAGRFKKKYIFPMGILTDQDRSQDQDRLLIAAKFNWFSGRGGGEKKILMQREI